MSEPTNAGAPDGARYFFIRRPVFASVISIVITLLGVFAIRLLPIARYPQISPPAVLGFGNANLDDNLRPLVGQAQPRAVLHFEQGQLGNADLPLRELLVRSLRLWGQLAGREALG